VATPGQTLTSNAAQVAGLGRIYLYSYRAATLYIRRRRNLKYLKNNVDELIGLRVACQWGHASLSGCRHITGDFAFSS
jgi:hypothetical protein